MSIESVRNIVNFSEIANFLWSFVSSPKKEGEEEVKDSEKGKEEGDGAFFWASDWWFGASCDLSRAKYGIEIRRGIGAWDMEQFPSGRLRHTCEGFDIDRAIDGITTTIIERFSYAIDEMREGDI